MSLPSTLAGSDQLPPPGATLIGCMPQPFENQTSHVGIVGTTGSGKSILIDLILRQVLPRIGSPSFPDHRALIFDGKGDAVAKAKAFGAGCPIHSLDPSDNDSSFWDLAQDLETPLDVQETCTTWAPDSANASEGSKYFNDAKRIILGQVITVLMRRAPKVWTLRDVCVVLLDPHLMKQVLGLYADTKATLETYTAAREWPGVKSTIWNLAKPLAHIGAAWSHASYGVSLKRWTKESGVLVLPGKRSYGSTIRDLNRVYIKTISQALLDAPDSWLRRTWCSFDEVRRLGKPAGLNEMLIEGRSKGICGVLGFQSVEGLRSEESLGPHLTNELLGQCNYFAFLAMGNDRPTAEWASQIMGEHFVDEYSDGFSQTTLPKDSPNYREGKPQTTRNYNRSRVKRPIVSPEDLMKLRLPNRETGLSGYCVGPEDPPTVFHFPGDFLFDEVLAQHPRTSQTVSRPPSHFELSPWCGSDLIRLNLLGALDFEELNSKGVFNIERLRKLLQQPDTDDDEQSFQFPA